MSDNNTEDNTAGSGWKDPDLETPALVLLKRMSNELRTYDFNGDQYKGKYIRQYWAKQLDIISGRIIKGALK